MQYTVENLAAILHGPFKGDGALTFSSVFTDSRQPPSNKDSIFFAINGNTNNGSDYIKSLYDTGFRLFVTSVPFAIEDFPGAAFIYYKDVLQALQRFAAHHRAHSKIPVVAIAGSNGKTVVKEWLYQLLTPDYNVVKSPGSFNSRLGVPLSLLLIDNSYNFALIEAGVSKTGEMQLLESIIKPEIGVFTHLGDAHNEGFVSKKQKLKEKLSLFVGAKLLVFCSDIEGIKEEVGALRQANLELQAFSWSFNDTDADVLVNAVKKENNFTKISATTQGKVYTFYIPFSDEASIHNALSCFSVIVALGLVSKMNLQRFEQLRGLSMRLEYKEGINNCAVINDTYSNDLDSLRIAINFLNKQRLQHSNTVIISDFFQTGIDNRELYIKVAKLLESGNIKRLIGVGTAICENKNAFTAIPDTQFFDTTEELILSLPSMQFSEEAILVKGSRAFGLERVSAMLEKHFHTTRLEISLGAIEHNLTIFRNIIPPGTAVMAMVKAFAYGSGSFEVAKMLEFHKADYLAVAYPDEGEQLRKAGIKLPIMVMNPDAESVERLLEYKLEPEVYSIEQLNKLLFLLKGRPIKIHIEIDTGMHRLGVEQKDKDMLLAMLSQAQNITVASVFSHLAASDDLSLDHFTKRQIDSFDKFSAEITKHFDYKISRHILNSAGILRFPKAAFDMVRLGIGLYGIDPVKADGNKLENVFSLKTTISQLRKVASGESVGYSGMGVANHDRTIAVVALGYADGYARQLGNGNGKMLVNGKLVPVVGNICMDMCMLDVTDVDCSEGDNVVVFGSNPSVYDVAKWQNTIPYEVLTSISQRVKRVYVSQ